MKQVFRVFFPFGIFFLCSVLFLAVSNVSVAYYYFDQAKEEIVTLEKDTKSYIAPLLEACAQIGLAGEEIPADRLAVLFSEYRKKGIVYKAFCVKEDGGIIAHSDPSEAKNLGNNIASDEFSYNIDQIFAPFKRNTQEIIFSHYYIIEKKVPFSKDQIRHIKKYISKDIDRNGWLLTRGMYRKGVPLASIAFIIDKEPAYSIIRNGIDRFFALLQYTISGSLGAAFLLSLFVFIRYRMIAKRAVQSGIEEEITIPQSALSTTFNRDEISDSAKAETERNTLSEEDRRREPLLYIEIESSSHSRKSDEILDAIPVRRSSLQ